MRGIGLATGPTPALVTSDYAVGLFDGEGCISASQGGARRAPYVQVQIAIASEDAVNALRCLWGGSVSARNKLTAGDLRLHIWRACGRTALPALHDIAESSIVKRRQAVLAISLVKMSRGTAGRGNFVLTEQQLEDRRRIAAEISALNGARSRFGVTA